MVNREQFPLFLLNFSRAIYVRDAGVAGSNPATPTILPKVDVFQRLGGPAAGASGAPFCNDFQGGSTADLAQAGTSVRVAWLAPTDSFLPALPVAIDACTGRARLRGLAHLPRPPLGTPFAQSGPKAAPSGGTVSG